MAVFYYILIVLIFKYHCEFGILFELTDSIYYLFQKLSKSNMLLAIIRYKAQKSTNKNLVKFHFIIFLSSLANFHFYTSLNRNWIARNKMKT